MIKVLMGHVFYPRTISLGVALDKADIAISKQDGSLLFGSRYSLILNLLNWDLRLDILVAFRRKEDDGVK